MKAKPAQSAPFGTAAVVFAAGIACTGTAMWWWASRDRQPAQSVTAPAEQVSEARPVPLIEAPVVMIKQIEKTPAASPNPFQRLPAGTPVPAPGPFTRFVHEQRQAMEVQARPPIVSLAWVRKLRESCAERAEKEKGECERLADLLERIVANPADVDDAWARDMKADLLELFGASARSEDFSLNEVTCNAEGCVLYWHSSDYADWRGAGSALLAELLKRPWIKEFDVRGLRRIGDFDPLTSTPWEMIVLDRDSETGERAQ